MLLYSISFRFDERLERHVFVLGQVVAQGISDDADELFLDWIAAGDELVGHGDVVHGFDPAITVAKEHGLAREARPVVADGVIGALLE